MPLCSLLCVQEHGHDETGLGPAKENHNARAYKNKYELPTLWKRFGEEQQMIVMVK